MMMEDESKSVWSNSGLNASKLISNLSIFTNTNNNNIGLENGHSDLNEKSIGVVNILLVQAAGLEGKNKNGYSDPYCKVYLGKDKHRYRSKTVASTLNPKWRESFTLSLIENGRNDILTFSLFNQNKVERDNYIGR